MRVSLADVHLARRRACWLADDDLEQGGLADAVAADEGDARPGMSLKVTPFEQGAAAEGLAVRPETVTIGAEGYRPCATVLRGATPGGGDAGPGARTA